MAKAYCPKCRKILTQVLSSFECLSTWNKGEDYYAPEDDCKLVKRCPACGTLARQKENRIHRPLKKIPAAEDIRPSRFKKGFEKSQRPAF